MAYSTADDIALSEQDLIELTDDTGSGSVDSQVLADAINRADRLIDSYLRGRYHVPFNPVPPEIRETSATLAKYFLRERRGGVPDGVRREFDLAYGFIKDLTTGKAQLDETGQPSDIDRSSTRILSNKTAESAVFPKSVLDRY